MPTNLPQGAVLRTVPSGLDQLAIDTPAAQAVVYLHGAHLAHWQPAGQKRDVLWLSGQCRFASDQPIRGGVPICFPWFGDRGDQPDAPPHGFARLSAWTLASARRDDDATVHLELRLASDSRSRALWPHDFELVYRLAIGARLTMGLAVHNTGKTAFDFEVALHTYFTVADVRQVSVHGLGETTYLDKTQDLRRLTQDDSPIRITRQTDRVYLDTAAACILQDPGLSRQVRIDKTGSQTTVVWNPWIEKARAMPDFGDQEWLNMLCIETACAKENKLTLPPGAAHDMTAAISVAPL